jgi:hypothetical protein
MGLSECLSIALQQWQLVGPVKITQARNQSTITISSQGNPDIKEFTHELC